MPLIEGQHSPHAMWFGEYYDRGVCESDIRIAVTIDPIFRTCHIARVEHLQLVGTTRYFLQ